VSNQIEPAYIGLFESGQLRNRVKLLNAKLSNCTVCPRHCGINRNKNERKYCRSGRLALVCSYGPHFGEEVPISGQHGSGTIFFGNCNLKCVFCQNSDISHGIKNFEYYEVPASRIARMMLELQNNYNCQNINLVSPSHFVPQIIEALSFAIPHGLRIPLVYNSNGYDDIETLQLLAGIIDIYMPDLKYSDPKIGHKYSDVLDYPEKSQEAISEMYHQTGPLQTDDNGVATEGLMIRHLVLPGTATDSIEILNWIAQNLSLDITISLLAQYHPSFRANQYPRLAGSLQNQEYKSVVDELQRLGFKNTLYQENFYG
jgi:putative pyruvate formate lyase activating enzyme